MDGFLSLIFYIGFFFPPKKLDTPKITITYIGFEDAKKSNWFYFEVGKALGPGHHQRRAPLQGWVFLLVFYCLESFLKTSGHYI
jgi:hypothetical protein